MTASDSQRSNRSNRSNRSGSLGVPPEGWRRWAARLTRSSRMGSGTLSITYPCRFKALVGVVILLSVLWVLNFALVVTPTLEEAKPNATCEYNSNQLAHSARMLFVYFMWFLCARAALFLPCILIRVIGVQITTHGCCHAYCVHLLLRDGPLYVFVLGALLFWFHIMQSPACHEDDPGSLRVLKHYAIYTNCMSMFCLVLAHWHNRILVEPWSEEEFEVSRGAEPDTMAKFVTLEYDERLFGDEEGKMYPADCPICLSSWVSGDVIKVTPCDHAFHEECLGGWLRTARTCAICRCDLVLSSQRPRGEERVQPVRLDGPAPSTSSSPSPSTAATTAVRTPSVGRATTPTPSSPGVPQESPRGDATVMDL